MANLSFNRVTLAGRLTNTPALKQTAIGSSIATFSIAVNRDYRRKDGIIPVDFFDCVAWGTLGESICKWFSKGDSILIEGSLQNQEYLHRDGTKRRKFLIVVNSFSFVEKTKKYLLSKESEDEFVVSTPVDEDFIPF